MGIIIKGVKVAALWYIADQFLVPIVAGAIPGGDNTFVRLGLNGVAVAYGMKLLRGV